MQKIIDDNVIKNDVFQQKNERIMARKRRIWFPGVIYHLMHRGVRRTAIFEDEMDYQVMLKLLKVSLEKYNCKLHAYCLMTNHIHLLLETNDMEIGKMMKYLSGLNITVRQSRQSGVAPGILRNQEHRKDCRWSRGRRCGC